MSYVLLLKVELSNSSICQSLLCQLTLQYNKKGLGVTIMEAIPLIEVVVEL